MHRFTVSERIDKSENINIYAYPARGYEPLHTHEFLELVYVLSGSGEHRVDDIRYPVERGNLLLINLGQTHAFQTDGEMVLVNLLVLPEFIDAGLVDTDNAMELLTLTAFVELTPAPGELAATVRFQGKELLETERMLKSMIHEFEKKLPGYKMVLRASLQILLARMFRAMLQESDDLLRQMDRITPDILSYIEENLSRRISLRELASKSFYSPAYFSRVFSETFGKTLTEYIHEKRIERACELLRTTNASVTQISLESGYRDRKLFYKIFKEQTALSPVEYRRRKRDADPQQGGEAGPG